MYEINIFSIDAGYGFTISKDGAICINQPYDPNTEEPMTLDRATSLVDEILARIQ